MYKFQHLVAKYKTASFLIIAGCVCTVYTILLMQLNIPTWGVFIVNLILAFVLYANIEYSPEPIMRKAFVELNENCNPYPLLEETEKLLTYKNSQMLHQIILINHAVALRSIGEYQRNIETLQTMNIDKVPGMLPMNKVVYYNNLMDACALLGKYDEAKVWYSKMLLIYADVTKQKQLKRLEHAVLCAKVFQLYCNKDYEKALSLLEEVKAENRKEEVESALLYAKIAIAMGNAEAARVKLQFVIENGNRLYAVTEARQMLEQME